MTIGDRIKKIRIFRKMTMEELGAALGFEGKNMSVRISQYETGARIPGSDMIMKPADALHCNNKAISDYSYRSWKSHSFICHDNCKEIFRCSHNL